MAVLLALGLLATASIAYGIRVGMRDGADLERRAEEALMFRRGVDPYMDEKDMTYPPSALPVFAVSVPLNATTTRRILWIGLNLAAIIALGWTVVAQWGQTWPRWVKLSYVLIVAAAKPSRGGMALGQFHLVPLALIVGAEALASHATISGILVGLALIKPTMALPYVLLLLVRKRWQTVFTAAAVQALLFAITSGQLRQSPWHLTREWLRNASAQNSQGTIDLPSVALRLIPTLAIRPTVITVVVLALAAVLFVRFRRGPDLGQLALATFVAAVFSYHRHYDLVLLLPTLAYLIDRVLRRGESWVIASAWGMAAILIFPSSSQWLGRLEIVYDQVFFVTCYVWLSVLITCLATELKSEVNGPSSPSP